MTEQAKSAVDRRGQLEIELEGVSYGLRPSFEAIEAIEAKCRPLGDLVELLNRERLPVAEMGLITAELMRAYGEAHPNDANIATYRAANPKTIARHIYDGGVTKARLLLFLICFGAYTGGYTASGEAKPAAGTKTSTTDAGSSE
jgi:hypothetical protein